jgi:ABC-2 type transport system permease protein
VLSAGLSLRVTDLPVAVQDFDDSPASRRLLDAFRASISLRLVAWPPDRPPADALASGAARAVLIVPEDFERDVARGVDTPVQLLVDAADANTAKLAAGYAGRIAREHNRSALGAEVPLVRPAVRLWYNPGLSSKKFYGPGIYVLGLSMFPALLAALAMAREVEQKTIVQVYVSSISAHEFLLGKIAAFTAVALAECALMLGLLFTYFELALVGDPTPFIVATVLYAVCVAAFGTMVGATIPSEVAALQVVALGGFLVVFLLSGLIFPIENIPAALRWISTFVWGRYYIEVVRDGLLQGGGWPAVGWKVGVIGLIAAVFYGIAWRRMRRMQLEA